MTPNAPLRSTTQMTFDTMFADAMTATASYKKTYAHALDLGIRPKDVVLYATGALRPSERERFQGQLLQSPWALSRVVAIVKTLRHPIESLQVRLRLLPILNEHTRSWEDEDLEGCKLLDTL